MATIIAPIQTAPRSTERAATLPIRLALRDFAPHAIALIPFSLAIGTASALNGLSLPQAAFGAVFLLAGTAQLTAVELLGSGAQPLVIIGTIILINARFIIYGAGLANWFRDVPTRRKLLLAIPLVDQSYFCCEERFATIQNANDRRRYYLTGSALLLTVFLSSELVGYLAGPTVPNWLGLHLAAPLAFAGMLVTSVQGRPHLAAALAATITVIFCGSLPGGLCLPLAIAAGLSAGNWTERTDT